MRTYAEAVAYAERQRTNPSQSWYRLCQKFARSCVGAAPYGLTARSAFASIPAKHRHTGTPPPGSLAYYGVVGAGHGVFMVGGGLCYSNDIKRSGKIDKVPWTTFPTAWNMPYLGWIDWTPSGALDIPGPPIVRKPVVHVSRVQPGDVGPEVLTVQKWLKAEPKVALDYTSGPGVFGPKTRDAYEDWQRVLGFTGDDADGKPGLTSLTELARRHGGLATP